MKLTVIEQGGWQAGMRPRPRVWDSSSLPAPAASELRRLVAAVKAGAPTQEQGPGRVRDGMTYTIKLEDEAGEETLRASAVSPQLADLLQWLEKHAAAK